MMARNNGWGEERPARGTRIWLESRQRRRDLGDQGGGVLALHAAMDRMELMYLEIKRRVHYTKFSHI
jgi:hypothetical protein